MKKSVRNTLIATAGVAAGAAAFTEGLYRYMFCRASSKTFELLFDSKGHEDGFYRYKKATAETLKNAPCREYTIRSERGERLRGYYYPCGAAGKKIAFIVHGYRSNGIATTGFCYDYYRSRGIDVFTCDHTASGESGGNYIGFDVLETEDCLAWVDFLRKTFGRDVRLILHGFSMGAATVLKMSGRVPDNVRFIVEDSGYINARASLRHQIGPMYPIMRQVNRAVAGYDLDDSDVTESMFRSNVPILFVHGRDDKLVPFENGPLLYELYGGEKDCFFPENTRHVESMYTSPVGYGAKLDSFLEKYMGENR